MSARSPRFVCAPPERAEVVETYGFTQEISRRPSLRMDDAATKGRVRVVTPLDTLKDSDGKRYTGSGVCQLGHLLFDETSGTDLERNLPEASRFGAVPLLVEEPRVASSFRARLAAIFGLDYKPRLPTVIPLEVAIELLDLDALVGAGIDLCRRGRPESLREIRRVMTQRPRREVGMLLIMSFSLRLPADLVTSVGEELEIEGGADLYWPVTPAPESVSLVEPGQDDDSRSRRGEKEVVVSYQPARRSFQATGLPFAREPRSPEDDFCHYRSSPCFIRIERPEDLADQAALRVKVEVTIEGLLLSGLQVRIFRADGGAEEPEVRGSRSRIVGDVELVLEDAVAHWRRSPAQHLHFENVILDAMRVQDVWAVLEDMGFEVRSVGDRETSEADDGLPSPRTGSRLIMGSRPEGAESLCLWVLLEGQHRTAERRTELGGGQTYTSEVASGDLKVFVRGQIHGNPRPVLDDIHELHERLRHQFQVSTDRR